MEIPRILRSDCGGNKYLAETSWKGKDGGKRWKKQSRFGIIQGKRPFKR